MWKQAIPSPLRRQYRRRVQQRHGSRCRCDFRRPGARQRPEAYIVRIHAERRADPSAIDHTGYPHTDRQLFAQEFRSQLRWRSGRQGFVESLNVPAVKMLQQYKYQRFYETLQQCGISTQPQRRYLWPEPHPRWLRGDDVGYRRPIRIHGKNLNHQTKNHGKPDPADFHPPNYKYQPQTPNPQPATFP